MFFYLPFHEFSISLPLQAKTLSFQEQLFSFLHNWIQEKPVILLVILYSALGIRLHVKG